MKTIIAIALIACALAFVSAQRYGGYQEAKFDKKYHENAYNAAVNHLISKQLISENSAPHLIGFYQKIVSGVIYRFIIGAGNDAYEVEIWEQVWEKRLDVQGYRKVPHKN